MKLKVGDIVEFKKYEDLTVNERMAIGKGLFPSCGKVKEINDKYFSIAESPYILSKKSVARVISGVDINSLNSCDEVLVKVTVKEVFNTFLQINESVDKSDVVKVLKRKEPERFIVQEKHYGMYISASGDLVSDKERAQIYTSREDADADAADMDLSRWDVILYGA